MKQDPLIKVLLIAIAMLLFLNLLYGNFSLKPAVAQKEGGQIGRYQVSAWDAQSGTYAHHNGYYIIDRTTGKVIDSKAKVHGPSE
ncbi:MAG: hypothetical protein AB1390_01025 [Nitrospirota bacterium]